VVFDAGRWLTDDIVLAALQSSSAVFLVVTQDFAAIRNAQRYIAALMRLGFSQDQLKIVVNRYQKKPETGLATIEQVRQTLTMPTFATIVESSQAIAAVNRGRPVVAEKNGDLDRAYRKLVDKLTGAGKEAAAKTA